MTEYSIQRALKSYFTNYDYKLFNSYIYAWESDFFGKSKSGYSLEVEIKVSKADFKKDFTHKTEKHLLLSNHKIEIYSKPSTYEFTESPILIDGQRFIPKCCPVNFVTPHKHLPNKFYYCVPEGLIDVSEVPSYAGLLYYVSKNYVKEVKKAPFLHKNVNNLNGALLSKFYHKSLNLRAEISDLIYSLDLKSDYRNRLSDHEKAIVERLLTKLL